MIDPVCIPSLLSLFVLSLIVEADQGRQAASPPSPLLRSGPIGSARTIPTVTNRKHCTKHSLWVASRLSYTVLVCGLAMKIDSANAQPMGSLIFEGGHKPFHALACPLQPASVRISRKA